MAKVTHADSVRSGQKIGIDEIGKDEGIERVAENDFVELAKLEEFMNQILTVVVYPDKEDGALPVVTFNVNGVNQSIIRNRKSKVKRKYVEAMARCRVSSYDQDVPNQAAPENINLKENNTLMYPFAVYEDPSPDGRPWLEAIMAE